MMNIQKKLTVFRFFFIFLPVGVIGFLLFSFYIFLYTSFPFYLLTHLAKKHGAEITSVTGSLKKGISLNRVSLIRHGIRIDCDKIDTKIDGIWDIIRYRSLVFKELNIKAIKVEGVAVGSFSVQRVHLSRIFSDNLEFDLFESHLKALWGNIDLTNFKYERIYSYLSNGNITWSAHVLTPSGFRVDLDSKIIRFLSQPISLKGDFKIDGNRYITKVSTLSEDINIVVDTGSSSYISTSSFKPSKVFKGVKSKLEYDMSIPIWRILENLSAKKVIELSVRNNNGVERSFTLIATQQILTIFDEILKSLNFRKLNNESLIRILEGVKKMAASEALPFEVIEPIN